MRSLRGILRQSVTLWAVVLVALLASLAPTGAGAPDDNCSRCKNVGMTPCGRHAKADAPCERLARYCSDIADCQSCGGAGWLDCAKCENDQATAFLAHRKARIADAREEFSWIEDEMERSVRIVESEHFVLVWEVEKLRVGRKNADGHALAHLYSERLEEVFAAYVEALEADADDFRNRPTVMVWGEKDDQLRASEAFCEEESESALKQMGRVARVSLCGVKPYYDHDEHLHRSLAHDVVHLLASTQRPEGWIGELRAGWVDAGFAHWLEERMFGACETICFHAHYFKQDLDADAWRKHVGKLVARDKVPDLTVLLAQNTETLDLEQHAVSFSLVDFLLSKGGSRFDTFQKRLRARSPARDALFEVYRYSAEDFEREWREWVEETY